MEINWSIIGWLAAIIFVYAFGIFEGRNQGRKRRIAEEQEEKKNQPPPLPETIKVDDPGLLRVKNENGVLTLDLDGIRVDAPSLLPNQRKRLIEILNLLRPWVEGKSSQATPQQPASNSAFESRLNSISSPPAAPPPAPVQPASSASSFVSPQDKPTASIPSKKKDDKPETAPTSMVGQINAILQLRIANTPLASQGVTMMELLSGGVLVYIGVDKYEGIEDVPSEEVKAAIRAAIAEWEKKYTPGLS